MNLLIITQKVDINDDVLGFFHNWIKEFAGHYKKVFVICLYKGEYRLPENVKVFSLGKEAGAGRTRRLFNFYKYIWRLSGEYDGVFVHMNPEYAVLGGLFWKARGKKVWLWFAHKSVNLKLRLAEKIADVIFTASEKSFRLPSAKLKVVGHGIDIEKFSRMEKAGADGGRIKFITVGRISPVKDYETLIRAVEILCKKKGFNNFNFAIIGGPGLAAQEDYFSSLKRIVSELKLDNIIKFAGSIPYKNIHRYLNGADVFLHSSRTGSLDKAVLEAMAASLVVVSSNESSKEILSAFGDDLIFPEGDAEKLADKLEKIMRLGAADRRAVGERLKQIAKEEHGLKNLIKKIASYDKAS